MISFLLHMSNRIVHSLEKMMIDLSFIHEQQQKHSNINMLE